MKRRSKGMTLIEVLVALAVLSLLSAGMIASFRIGHRTYDRILKADRTYWDVVVAQRFLRTVLESTYPFETGTGNTRTAGLEGTADHIELTAPGSQASDATGFRRFSFVLVRRGDGYEDLVSTSQLDRNGTARAGVEPREPSAEVLISRVKGIEWDYLDPSSSTWRSSWSERRPPSLVRLRVEFPPGDSRRWPELIVAPRVTDDANCSFDVVAQACREAQS
jgi:general secretion pathway protein J